MISLVTILAILRCDKYEMKPTFLGKTLNICWFNIICPIEFARVSPTIGRSLTDLRGFTQKIRRTIRQLGYQFLSKAGEDESMNHPQLLLELGEHMKQALSSCEDLEIVPN